MLLLSSFEFLTLGGVFLGVKNNSKNFGNKKNIRLLSKILSKLTLFIRKMLKFWCFYELIAMAKIFLVVIRVKNPDFCFFHFLENFIISFFFKNALKMFVWVWPIILWTKKTPFGGGFCSRGPNVKNQFFGKKIFGQIFWKKYFAQLMRNFFLILKWFYFLSFAQNWLICEGLKFSLLKMNNFPFSGVSAPGTP